MRYMTSTERYDYYDYIDGRPNYGADPVNDQDRGANDEWWDE